MKKERKIKFKEIICPVCGKMKFTKPQDDIDEKNIKDGFYDCYECGWIYDIKQIEDPNYRDGFNKKTIDEMRDDYKKGIMKVKVNPKVKHMCPVCGEYMFPSEDSFDICPVCGWEDDGALDGSGANEFDVRTARKIFNEKRKNDKKYKWINKIK